MYNIRKIQKRHWGSPDLQVPPQPKWFLFFKLKVQLYQLETFQGNVCVIWLIPRGGLITSLPLLMQSLPKKQKGSLRGFSRTSELNTWAELASLSPPSPAVWSLQRLTSHSQYPQSDVSKGQNEWKWCCWCKVIYFRISSGQAHSAPSWIFTQGILTGSCSAANWGEKLF